MAIGSAMCSCLFAVHRAITCCLGADTVKSDTGFDSYVLDHIFEKHQAQIWHGQVNIPFDRTPNWTGAYTLRHVYFYLLFVVNLFLHFAAPRSSYLASLACVVHAFTPKDNELQACHESQWNAAGIFEQLYRYLIPLAMNLAAVIDELSWDERLDFDNHTPHFPFLVTSMVDTMPIRVYKSSNDHALEAATFAKKI